MPKLPEVSGRELAALLERQGYVLLRARGSHAQYARDDDNGRHTVTVPVHRVVAKGTLSDILKRIGQRTGRTVDELLDEL